MRSNARRDGGPTIQFLGAAGTVTGSKHLVTAGGRRVLLDCGLFQGLKALRLRNWGPPPVDPATLDAVVLSHAHVDHSGYLPVLVRHGFRGPVYCTAATAELLRVLLLDAAHLQEEEADFANRHGASTHRPALPLYTTADAEAALGLVQVAPWSTPFRVCDGATATYRRAGHILGSATTTLALPGVTVAYSGDLGRYDRPILHDPEPVPEADVLLVESTYGDRTHAPDPATTIATLVRETAACGGVALVPAFAVDRTQELLWILRKLEDEGRIPALPVFVDSPMAISVTEIYARHHDEHDLDVQRLARHGESPLETRNTTFLRTPEESKRVNARPGPMIVVSASGMATGGRILHHLAQRLPDPATTVLLAGFQAAGTRGRALLDGARSIRIFGQDVPVRARVAMVDGLSAHADRDDLLRWLGGFRRPPRATYVVHGEPQAADTLAATMRHRLGWAARVAEDREIVAL